MGRTSPRAGRPHQPQHTQLGRRPAVQRRWVGVGGQVSNGGWARGLGCARGSEQPLKVICAFQMAVFCGPCAGLQAGVGLHVQPAGQ